MQPIVYTPSRKRTLTMLVAALAITAVCAALPFLPGTSVKGMIAAGVGVPFFGLGTIVFARQLSHGKPVLTVTDTGFEARQFGRIGWEEVGLVDVYGQLVRGRTYRHIRVILKDPDATLSRMGRGVRMTMSVNQRWGGHVFVAGTLLPVPVEEAVAVMQQAHQRFLGFEPVSVNPTDA